MVREERSISTFLEGMAFLFYPVLVLVRLGHLELIAFR
jgi:hypothetical protein